MAPMAEPAGAAGASADWPSFLFDAGHSSFNAAATTINTGNLVDLQPVWKWTEPTTSYSDFDASPIVVDGVVYIGSESGYFYAIDEATQTVLWSRFLGLTPNAECGGSQGITGTAAVADDPATGLTVYVNAPDGQLYALAATTGATLWQSTVDTPSSTLDDYYTWGSPLVANGQIYIGISSSCDAPLIPGGVLEFDQDTGAPSGAWQALPKGLVGASVWSSVGESTLGDGSVFATTGNTNTKAQPQYNESIVRLSGSGLSLLDSWELPQPPEISDSDFGGSPTMFTADLNGTETPMVGACNKNGTYYAFRQNDLHDGPVWQDQVAAPFGTQPDPGGQCDAAALWDGTNLIESGGNATTIDGVTYQGSVQSLNPATGMPVWQTGLPGALIGSPTEDGAGVVAAQVYSSATGNLGVYLLDADSGAILKYLNTGPSGVFAQPVFAGDQLLVAGTSAIGVTAYGVTTQGPPVSSIAPQSIGVGASVTFTLTGSNFSGTPQVLVSGTYVTASSVVVDSPTSLQVKLTVSSKAAPVPGTSQSSSPDRSRTPAQRASRSIRRPRSPRQALIRSGWGRPAS